VIRVFASPLALAQALADDVAAAITNRLQRDGRAAIAVSGGTTPIQFFQTLSQKPLDWGAVTITLVDDRWVPASSPRSNARLVQTNLLQAAAAAAGFVALTDTAISPELGRAGVNAALSGLPLPFAAVTLGMGNDGHTASFFPGGDRLAEALAPSRDQRVETMRADAAVEPRITLTLPLLLAADFVAIHIQGPEKRATLERAVAPGPVAAMPVRAVLARQPVPDVYWCA
jgi:6-phosphogluconolactonase